ncbi:MAG: radical SAM protein [Phycisphaerales bacterium]|nr:radical SAM protein [Phycisphaerales bacterium]
MKIKAWRLPWKDQWVPHALLDILRGCNIHCRACYNTQSGGIKSFQQVCEEFELIRQHRRLDSISIVGGEPTLHPNLLDIIRYIKAAGVSVELFSNGLSLTPTTLDALKSAGTSLIFMHIDAQQNRPDLPVVNAETLAALRSRIAADIAAAGMEVGLAITGYAGAVEEIDAGAAWVLASPHVDYFLVTLCRDTPGLGRLEGDIGQGIHRSTSGMPPPLACRLNGWNNLLMHTRMLERFGLRPFAWLGSNVDAADPRWLSYLIGAVVGGEKPAYLSALKASWLEPFFMRLYRLTRGRYPFYMPQSPGRFRVQLLLNAISGGRFAGNLSLLAKSFGSGGKLRAKRILFQNPAEVGADGRLIHCEQCPDATVRDGRLVPTCAADQIGDGMTGGQGAS